MSSVGAAIFGRALRPMATPTISTSSPSPAPVKTNSQGEKRQRAASEAAAKSNEAMKDDESEEDSESSSDEDEKAKKKPCLKKDTSIRIPSSSPKNSHYLVSQIDVLNNETLLASSPVKMRAAINQVLCDYIGSPECKEQFMRALTAANGNYDAMDPNWWQPTKLSTVVALLGKMFAKGAAVVDTEKPSSSK